MTAKRVLVIGSSGQLAQCLAERGPVHDVGVVLAGRPAVDLAVGSSLAPVIAAAAPDVVVNAAAYTQVDKAEAEPEQAMAINGTGAGALAAACAAAKLPLIHISTDYVFDGRKQTPYIETDPTGPLGVYGRSKLAGEAAVAAHLDRHLIFRTAWVFSPFGQNFAKTMLRLAETRDVLSVVDDQHGSPTYAIDLADAVLSAAVRISRDARFDAWGITNVAGSGETTWCGLAREIFAVSRELGGPSARVEPIPTEGYPTPAQRPKNSRLDMTRLAEALGVTMPDWRSGVRRCVERLVSPSATSRI